MSQSYINNTQNNSNNEPPPLPAQNQHSAKDRRLQINLTLNQAMSQPLTPGLMDSGDSFRRKGSPISRFDQILRWGEHLIYKTIPFHDIVVEGHGHEPGWVLV